jgi:hypothetical protein
MVVFQGNMIVFVAEMVVLARDMIVFAGNMIMFARDMIVFAPDMIVFPQDMTELVPDMIVKDGGMVVAGRLHGVPESRPPCPQRSLVAPDRSMPVRDGAHLGFTAMEGGEAHETRPLLGVRSLSTRTTHSMS